MTLGTFKDPKDIAAELLKLFGPDDACVECGYGFHYVDEGCDTCAWITDALSSIDQIKHSDEIEG